MALERHNKDEISDIQEVEKCISFAEVMSFKEIVFLDEKPFYHEWNSNHRNSKKRNNGLRKTFAKRCDKAMKERYW